MILFLGVAVLVLAGLASILIRRTVIKVLVGVHLIFLAGSLAFLAGGFGKSTMMSAELMALLCYIIGLAQILVGLSFAIRLFYLRGNAGLQEVSRLRR
jgi:NADH:ubiquinone oxidoreductase subunit K